MDQQVRDVVRNIFVHLDNPTLQEFLNVVKVNRYPAQEHLCHEGALERTFYIIVDGEVEVTKSRAGTTVLLDRKREGSFFGEIALLKNKPRTADVVTSRETTVVELDLAAFREIISRSPEFFDHLTRVVDEYEANHRKLQKTIIFTSYSRKDERLVKRLVSDLRRELINTNIFIWLDQTEIKPGKDWDDAIEEALNQSVAMLLILSNASVKSGNVKGEWNYCLEEGKVIIPVRIESDCKLPFRLRTYHYLDLADYNNEDNYARGLERIANILREVEAQANNT